MKLQNLNDQMMVTAAHRYCLGRTSYIIPMCTKWIMDTWEQMEKNTRTTMVRDTAEALMDDMAGDKFASEYWHLALSRMWEKLGEGEKHWILHALEYKKKPWPLDGKTGNPEEFPSS